MELENIAAVGMGEIHDLLYLNPRCIITVCTRDNLPLRATNIIPALTHVIAHKTIIAPKIFNWPGSDCRKPQQKGIMAVIYHVELNLAHYLGNN